MADLLSTKIGKRQLVYTYAAFALNGALALSIGSILPYLKAAYNLSYAFAGLIVSLHSVGNFAAGFLAGTLSVTMGRKKSVLFFNIFFAISYLLIAFGANSWCLALAFFLTGIARGASSNFSNTVINNLAPGRASILNGLHAMFSVGALLFPVVFTILTREKADNWILAVYGMAGVGVLSFVLCVLNPIDEHVEVKTDNKAAEKGLGFFCEPLFYLVTLTLFFYLCIEQGVIGWMVTYFSDSGLLSDSMSQLTGSVMWTMMLIGRLATAWASSRYKKENMLIGMGAAVVLFFFWLLISRSTVTIMAGIAGFGLSMAGIYATTVSFAGRLLKTYPLCWSFILTIASFGSIIMPAIMGAAADNIGIEAGMSSVMIVVVLDFILIVCLRRFLKAGRAV